MSKLKRTTYRFVLIDDDESYRSIMRRVAEIAGVQLDTFSSLGELGSVGLLARYDVAIVDYNLEEMTGLEIAEYLNTFFGNIPMILISQSMNLEGGNHWPMSVVSYIPKSAGYRYVIDQAVHIMQTTNKRNWVTNMEELAYDAEFG